MDIDQLEHLPELIKDIQVINRFNEDVEVINNTEFGMIGKGRQGAVFKINEDVCFKIFGNAEDCDREYYALSLGQHTNLFPKVYKKGPLFIVMEMIKGVDLREYLQSQPLTYELSWNLIVMLHTFKTIGFERIDHHKRQIYMQEDGSLKVIDVARTVWRDRVYPYPRKLLTSFGEENKQIFLSHVQEMAPELYDEWIHYIRMEEMSRQILQLMLPDTSYKRALKKMTETLMTTNDEKNYVILLEGLVHKVFKEEWVKTMLARGVDIEKVMGKIDEYWDKLEQSALNGRNRLNERDSRRENDKKRLKERDKRLENDKNRGKHNRYEGEKSHPREGRHDHGREHSRGHRRGKDKHHKKK